MKIFYETKLNRASSFQITRRATYAFFNKRPCIENKKIKYSRSENTDVLFKQMYVKCQKDQFIIFLKNS